MSEAEFLVMLSHAHYPPFAVGVRKLPLHETDLNNGK